jgi:hypothetical protein
MKKGKDVYSLSLNCEESFFAHRTQGKKYKNMDKMFLSEIFSEYIKKYIKRYDLSI